MKQKSSLSSRLFQSNILHVSLLVLVYFLYAQLHMHFVDRYPFFNYLSLPSGFALAILLLCGMRVSLGLLIGVVLAAISMPQLLVGSPVKLASYVLSGVLEPIFAFYILKYLLRFDAANLRLRDLFAFFNLVLFTPLVSVACNILEAYLSGSLELSLMQVELIHIWQRNALSYLLFTPFVLSLFYNQSVRWTKFRVLELSVLSALLVILCAFVFFDAIPMLQGSILQPKAFMLFPLAMWAALSFNQRGSSTSVLLIAVAGLVGASQHLGVYAINFEGDDLSNYGMFMLLLAVTGSTLSVLNVGKINSEERLKEQLHVYDTLLSAQADAGEGVVIIDGGKISYFNEAFSRIVGYGVEDIKIGSNFFSLIHPYDRERVRAAYLQRMDGLNVPRRYDTLVLVKDGSTVPVEVAAASFRDGSGRVVVLMSDISQRKKAEIALTQSQTQYRELVESVHAVVCRSDIQGKFTFVSHEAEALLGFPLARWTQSSSFWRDQTHPDDQAWVIEFYQVEAVKLESFTFEYRMLAAENRVVWVQHMVKVIPNQSGTKPLELVGVMLDVTERKEAEASLRLSRQVFEHTVEGIVITDVDFHVLEVNTAYSKITGYKREEIIGHPFKVFSTGLHDRKFYDSIWYRIEHQGQWVGEIWNLRKNGEQYPEWLSISAVHDQKGVVQNYVAVMSDITQRKRSEERLQFLANHDALTQLPNRALMHERGDLAVVRANRNQTKIAVLFIDLDRFKIINDTLGHQSGDMLLQEVARRLRECLRETDFVARQGGDEFVVIIENFEHSQYLTSVAQKIMSVLAQPLVLMNQELHVSASIGISVYPEDGVDIFTLLKHADVAMYRAKESGKNAFHFYAAENNQHSVELLALESSLRRAVERNELRLHYQPKIDLRTNEIVGAEALIRWQHLDLGLLSPSQFIALAEETGLIIEIGAWVMQEACKHAQSWQHYAQSNINTNIRVAVNLSARQFREDGLHKTIADALVESGLSAECLELEITESMIMQNAERANLLLQHFRKLGAHVLIDDFGTGYSSLSYLKQFPIDSLKIDRSFVCDIPEDKDDMAITQAIIAMAHSLNLKVVAEGVETQAQFDFLKHQDCDQVQGYIYSEPVTNDAFIELLKAQPIKQWLAINRTLTLVS